MIHCIVNILQALTCLSEDPTGRRTLLEHVDKVSFVCLFCVGIVLSRFVFNTNVEVDYLGKCIDYSPYTFLNCSLP